MNPTLRYWGGRALRWAGFVVLALVTLVAKRLIERKARRSAVGSQDAEAPSIAPELGTILPR